MPGHLTPKSFGSVSFYSITYPPTGDKGKAANISLILQQVQGSYRELCQRLPV